MSKTHPVVFSFGGSEYHLTLDEAHLALARLRDAIGSALDGLADARSVPPGAQRYPGEPEYSYRPVLREYERVLADHYPPEVKAARGKRRTTRT